MIGMKIFRDIGCNKKNTKERVAKMNAYTYTMRHYEMDHNGVPFKIKMQIFVARK